MLAAFDHGLTHLQPQNQSLAVIMAGVFLCGLAGQVSSAAAEEVRLYTCVRQAVPGSEPVVISRSVTLFHAGMVYDYIDAARELIVYDPARREFSIIQEDRQLATKVSQDEIRHFMELAEQAAEDIIERAVDQGPQEQAAAAMLKFQISPRFEEQYDPTAQQLTLKSNTLTYRVQTFVSPDLEAAAGYLRYADWISPLNSVLHPQASLPGPRLELNAALTQHQRLPLRVELTLAGPAPMQLTADHEWTWKLAGSDRELITRWQQLRQSSELKWVPLRQFQHQVLTASTPSR